MEADVGKLESEEPILRRWCLSATAKKQSRLRIGPQVAATVCLMFRDGAALSSFGCRMALHFDPDNCFLNVSS